ncbi:hypothetical protein [Bacillus marinisedimentorum]|uniref:hypothetical protein n=1 Tax=Bacillus marinisedimentorum TaxID=1821260 RepID=UPI00087295D7|nr:hypothetical protein [Bacillus marinisedimentorum]
MDYVVHNKRMAEEKLRRLQQGYCAYVESKEVAALIKKQLNELHIPVHEEITDRGYWYTPEKEVKESDSGDVVIIN